MLVWLIVNNINNAELSLPLKKEGFFITWGFSSVGRAGALQVSGQEFDSLILHKKLNYDYSK